MRDARASASPCLPPSPVLRPPASSGFTLVPLLSLAVCLSPWPRECVFGCPLNTGTCVLYPTLPYRSCPCPSLCPCDSSRRHCLPYNIVVEVGADQISAGGEPLPSGSAAGCTTGWPPRNFLLRAARELPARPRAVTSTGFQRPSGTCRLPHPLTCAVGVHMARFLVQMEHASHGFGTFFGMPELCLHLQPSPFLTLENTVTAASSVLRPEMGSSLLHAWSFHAKVIAYDMGAYASYSFAIRGTPLGQHSSHALHALTRPRTSKSAVSASRVA